MVFFDGRNAIEAQVGRFRNAVVPPVATTRDFVPLLDAGAFDHLKGPHRGHLTVPAGAHAVDEARGFGDVYQLDGGIVRYGETHGTTACGVVTCRCSTTG